MRTSRWLVAPLMILVFLWGAETARSGTDLTHASMLWLQGADVETALDAAPASEMVRPARDIRVQLWHDKADEEAYSRGEALNVHFRTNADLYVTLYRIDADGYVEVLWPTSRMDDGFVYGNHTYSLPRPGSQQRLRVSQVQGVEYIQAIASEYPFDLRGLGIDFAFELGSEAAFAYRVEGDPFLAINDINYAITGLEEDQDFIVTDWAHVYVESQVDYPRYACNQCHVDGSSYHPYVDTCSRVAVYYDYGWHSRWYISFGWYPLYYEPPFYYWDYVYYRPYWYWYYPVCYSWPYYPVYARPYPVYAWHDHPYYWGDYNVRYKRGVTSSSPLYDVSSPSTRRAIREHDRSDPASARQAIRRAGDERRVSEDRLVRSGMTPRSREELRPTSAGASSRDRGRSMVRDALTGVRTDLRSRSDRRITSLRPVEDSRTSAAQRRSSGSIRSPDSNERSGRTWTRPVIRNADPQRGSDRSSIRRSQGDQRSGDRSSIRRDSDRQRTPRASEVQPGARPRSGSDQRGVERSGSRGQEVRPPAPPSSRRNSPPSAREVKPRSGGNSQRSSPPPSSPPPRGGRSGGGSRQRGGGRG